MAERRRLEALKGTAAVANAKVVYERFRSYLSGRDWQLIAASGAKVQRILWASTGTKDPAYSDVLYVDELIGEHTVNTLPEVTWKAFNDHGTPARTVDRHLDDAHRTLRELGQLGIDMERVGAQLQAEGVELFAKAFDAGRGDRRTEAQRRCSPAKEADVDREALEAAVQERLAALAAADFSERLWAADPTLWKADDDAHQKIVADALGWLSVFEGVRDEVHGLGRVRRRAARRGLPLRGPARHGRLEPGARGHARHPRHAPGLPRPARARFHRPGRRGRRRGGRRPREHAVRGRQQVRRHHRDGAASTPTSTSACASSAATTPVDHFVAITDEGTSLEKQALDQGFRAIFVNPGDIGGRYSALSFFGMVPAALIGVDLERLLDGVRAMAVACGPDVPAAQNPALRLGAAMGELALRGRDKLTLVFEPPLAPLGAWVEQLVAESTGKEGTGIVPVDLEQLGPAGDYGDDRVFVSVRLAGARRRRPRRGARGAARRRPAGAGAPDRRRARSRRRVPALGDRRRGRRARARHRRLRPAQRAGEQGHHQGGCSPIRRRPVSSPPSRRRPTGAGWSTRWATRACRPPCATFLAQAAAGDYVALQAYVAPGQAVWDQLQAVRLQLRDGLRVATTLGYGPRYLHSTGQLHKGGPDTGLFLQLLGHDPDDVAIPGQPYSFGVLKRAQARGDLTALRAHGRRAMRVCLGDDVPAGLARLAELVAAI